MQFVQTVEDHILADAVIRLCNRMGTRLHEFGPESKRTIDTAYTIAQERRKLPIYQGSKFMFGPELWEAKEQIADACDKRIMNL